MTMIAWGRLKYLSAILILCGCSWWEEDVLHVPPTPEFVFSDGLDRINLTATPAGDEFNYSWHSSVPLTITQDPDDELKAWFVIPPGTTGGNADITLEVSRKKRNKVSTQSIAIPAYSLLRAYGLGTSATVERSNDVDYEWYIDQQTSTYPLVDCGPSSVTMAIKWYNKSFTGSPALARSIYRSQGGWWFTGDIVNYLVSNGVPNFIMPLSSVDEIKSEIDKGNIMILCLDMYYVSNEVKSEYRLNKFYPTAAPDWGHFIVIKGYKDVETLAGKKTFLEAYDPYSLGRFYADHALKGKNRYYAGAEIIKSSGIWWRYAIVIAKNSNNARVGLDIADIPQQRGR